jgi:hypothetical protein
MIDAIEVRQLIRHAEGGRDEDQTPAEDRAQYERQQVREPGKEG